MRLQKLIDTKDFTPNLSWLVDAVYMQDHSKMATICDDRK